MAETAILTLLALLAFAANSILTRLALGGEHIDAASFTVARLTAGAVVLAALARAHTGTWAALAWRGAAGPFALLAYAAPFSFAYLRIGAALGALVLFGAVQITVLAWSVVRGERPTWLAWLGSVLALVGLGALLLPSAARPDPIGVVLMAIAGMAWGAYTLVGKRSGEPLVANARAFVWSLPAAVFLALPALLLSPPGAGARGIALALFSGGVTSGLGYAVWYRALRGLTGAQAAVLQLSVPVLAALGAVVLLGERLDPRLLACGAVVLLGVAVALAARRSQP